MPEQSEGEKMMTIGEAAKVIGVHVKTLRGWVDKDLVPHVRLPSGYRRFTVAQVDEIRRNMIRGAS